MLASPVLFYLLVFICIKEAGMLKFIKNYTKKDYLFIEIIFAFVLCFTYFMVRKDQYIYFWDYGREWRTAIIVRNGLLKNSWDEIKDIYLSINYTDYNKFMPMLITLALYALGSSYKAFVLLVAIFYLCPAIFIISVLIDKILNLLNIKNVKITLICLIVASTPILYYVLLNSFMDPPELMLVSCIIALSVDIDYSVLDLKKDVLVSICLILSVLFRRHFAYFGMGFACSQFIYFLINYRCIGKTDRKILLRNFAYNMLLIACLVIAVLLLLFKPFVMRSLFTDYSVKHQAWNQTINEKLFRMVEVFGWLYLIIFMTLPLLYSRKVSRYNIVFPILCNAIITTVAMWRVQQLNYHQYYLIIVQVIILFCVGVFGFFQNIYKKNKLIFSGILVIFMFLNMMGMFYSPMEHLPLKTTVTSTAYRPKVRNDIDTIQEIVNDMQTISKNDSTAFFYVLSSSGILNSSIITMSRMPYLTNAVPQMAMTADVDMFSGFSIDLLKANYVLVADPIQTHQGEQFQHVITYPSKLMLDSTSYLGKHYKLLREYDLDGNVKAKLYKKISILDDEVYDKMSGFYNTIYPTYPEMFADRIIKSKPVLLYKAGEQTMISDKDGIMSSQFPIKNGKYESNGKGYLTYGPYTSILKGKYTFIFDISYDGNLKEGTSIGNVEISLNGQSPIKNRQFFVGDSKVKLENVDIAEDDDRAEYRIYANVSNIVFNEVQIIRED